MLVKQEHFHPRLLDSAEFDEARRRTSPKAVSACRTGVIGGARRLSAALFGGAHCRIVGEQRALFPISPVH